MSTDGPLFPLFLKLSGKRVLVVGGGPVALEKSRTLVSAGADVRVVAPDLVAGFDELDLTPARRPFAAEDVDDVWLVISAATAEVNRAVLLAASERQRFAIAVDDPDSASAFGAATLERGGVTFALSSSGRAPALVALLRRALDRLLPHDLDGWRRLAEGLRPEWKAQAVPMAARTPLLLSALNAIYGAQHEKKAAS